MAHGLSKKDSMFSVHETPWHGLGAVLEKRPKTIEEAVEKSGLGWDVIQRPVKVSVPEIGSKTKNKLTTLDDYVVNLRSDTMDPLGVVTKRYVPVQNIEAFSFLANIFQSEMHFETAGSLHGGRRVWVMLRLPENIEVAGDKVVPYAFIQNSHDGKTSVTVALTPVRIVCNNTLTAAMNRAKGRDAKRTVSIRHLGDMEKKIEEARSVLDVTVHYYGDLKKVGDALGSAKCSDKQAKSYVERLFSTEGLGEDAAANRIEIQNNVIEIFKGNGRSGNTQGNSGQSFWTLYNAAIEHLDWERDSRVEGSSFSKAIYDPDGLKAKAWDICLDQTGLKTGTKNKSLVKI